MPTKSLVHLELLPDGVDLASPRRHLHFQSHWFLWMPCHASLVDRQPTLLFYFRAAQHRHSQPHSNMRPMTAVLIPEQTPVYGWAFTPRSDDAASSPRRTFVSHLRFFRFLVMEPLKEAPGRGSGSQADFWLEIHV